jgi:hypothetical protein
MKKKTGKKYLHSDARSSEKPSQRRFFCGCGKALLLTASYQVFSVFLGSTDLHASQISQGQNPIPHVGIPSQVSSLSLNPETLKIPNIYVNWNNIAAGCIGCTDCTSCTMDCTGCTGRTDCQGCTGCTDCTGCMACISCTGGCTGCTACTDCTARTGDEEQKGKESK